MINVFKIFVSSATKEVDIDQIVFKLSYFTEGKKSLLNKIIDERYGNDQISNFYNTSSDNHEIVNSNNLEDIKEVEEMYKILSSLTEEEAEEVIEKQKALVNQKNK